MKKLVWLVVIAALVGGSVYAAESKAEPAGKPGVVLGDMVTIRAIVQSIDYDKRMVVLKGPKGNMVNVYVDETAKNFNQIKKGDEVLVDYYESVALFVRKSDEAPVAEETDTLATAPVGQKPERTELRTIKITATVMAIDPIQRTVTVKGPEGNELTFKGGKNADNLDAIKVGDEVVAEIVQALAISVRKP